MVPKGQIHQRCTALLRWCTPHTQWDDATCLICANLVHCLYSNCITNTTPWVNLFITVHSACHPLPKRRWMPSQHNGTSQRIIAMSQYVTYRCTSTLETGQGSRSIHMAWTSQEKSLRPQTVSSRGVKHVQLLTRTVSVLTDCD